MSHLSFFHPLLFLCGVSAAMALAAIAVLIIDILLHRPPAPQQRRPDTPPWLRDRRWASGTIREEQSGLIVLWLITLVLNGFSFVFLLDFQNPVGRRNAPFFVLAFPLLGLLVACCAIHCALRQRKYGRSIMHLSSLPGQIGGKLAGTIITSKTLLETTGLRLTLACINRVTTGGGKSRMIRDIPRWQSSLMVTGLLPSVGDSTRIPVIFDIPPDCKPTDRSDANNIIFWRLTARAPEPGIDYAASFLVPVFACDKPTNLASPVAIPPSARIVPVTPGSAFPEERGITLARENSGAALTIRFSSLRRPMATVTTAFFSILFTVLTASAAALTQSIVLSLVLGLIDLIFIKLLCRQLFQIIILRVAEDGIAATASLLRTRTIQIPSDQIHAIHAELNSTAGNAQFFDLNLTRSNGNKITLVRGLTSLDAQWLQRELATRFNLPVDPAPATDMLTPVA